MLNIFLKCKSWSIIKEVQSWLDCNLITVNLSMQSIVTRVMSSKFKSGVYQCTDPMVNCVQIVVSSMLFLNGILSLTGLEANEKCTCSCGDSSQKGFHDQDPFNALFSIRPHLGKLNKNRVIWRQFSTYWLWYFEAHGDHLITLLVSSIFCAGFHKNVASWCKLILWPLEILSYYHFEFYFEKEQLLH